MTKLKPYPEYKDSGVEWLDQIPASWTILRTSLVTNLTTGWTPPTGDSESYIGTNLWANISDLGPRVLKDTAKRISDTAIAASRMSKSPKGSLLFSFKLSVGQVSFAGRDMFTNEAIATFAETESLSLRFAYYALPEFLIRNAGENIYGAKLLNQELMRSARLCIPPKVVQEQIAGFLDRETAQIDDLIGKQERLIDLLTEKRQGIITHAVSAPVGIATPSKVRYQATLNPSVRPALKSQQDAQRTFLPMNSIGERGTIDLGQTRPVREVLGGYSYFQDEDVCFAKVTPCFENGKGAVFRGLRSGEGFGTTELTVLRCRPSLDPDYLYLLTQSDLFRKNGVAAMTGAGGLRRVPDEFVRNFDFNLPALTTQTSIVASVKKQLAIIDQLIGRTQRTLILLAERRSALISAAVTGKIDVRKEAS